MKRIPAEFERLPGDPVADLPSLILGLSAARELTGIIDLVRTGARRLTGADGVSFVLREGDQCHYADEDAISPLWKGQRFPAETCISGWAMINRRAAVIEDIYKDSRIPADAYRLTFVRSLVMVPVGRDQPVATIGAYWADRHLASPAEVALLEAVAAAAGAAMAHVEDGRALRRSAAVAWRHAAAAERRLLELTRVKADLELANQQKSLMLSACSHDLRQPFQAMHLLQGVLAERVTGSNRIVVDNLGRAITQGEELLDHLLAASRNDLPPAPWGTFPLNEVLDRLRLTFGGPAQEKGLELRIVPSRHWVRSDPILLARIVGNFVSNAVKYADRGRILVGARRHGDLVGLEVWDTGIGIAAEHLDRIFSDFYQVDNPDRDQSRGIGLGLGIVRHLSQHLGHEVDVRSVVGRGSVFSVRVPLVR